MYMHTKRSKYDQSHYSLQESGMMLPLKKVLVGFNVIPPAPPLSGVFYVSSPPFSELYDTGFVAFLELCCLLLLG